MSAGQTLVGYMAKLYVAPIADWSNPTWTEIENVRNLTLNVQTAIADVTSRAHSGWRAQIDTLMEASIEFEMLDVLGDPDLAQLRQYAFNRTLFAVLCLDAPRTQSGAWGVKAPAKITRFSRNEQLEQGIAINVTLTIASYLDTTQNPPVWRVPELFVVS